MGKEVKPPKNGVGKTCCALLGFGEKKAQLLPKGREVNGSIGKTERKCSKKPQR